MSMSIFMCMDTSFLKSPSTLKSVSMAFLMAATWGSARSCTFVEGSTWAFSSIFLAEVWPMPKIFVRATSILLFLLRSTPAILANLFPPFTMLTKGLGLVLSLPLLVLGVFAYHPYNAASLHDLALRADLFYRAPYLHLIPLLIVSNNSLLCPVCYPAPGEVIRRK